MEVDMPKLTKNINEYGDYDLLSIPDACKYLNVGRYTLEYLFSKGLKHTRAAWQIKTTKKWINNFLKENKNV